MEDWTRFNAHILMLERRGLVTRTFRRLDAARQQSILHGILEEAAVVGPTDVNIKRVAERTGSAVGSLYQYFGSRDNLVKFSIEICAAYLEDALDEFRAVLMAQPLGEALASFISGGTAWSSTGIQAGLLRFYARAAYAGDPELAESFIRPVAAKMRNMVLEILRAAAARGELRADVDLEAAATVVYAQVIPLIDVQLLPHLNHYFLLMDNPPSFERVHTAALAMILRGITTS